MSNERVRQVERSYMSFVLRKNPDFYAEARNTNRAEYEFSNGRRFMGHDLYSNYFPREFQVIDEGIPVFDEGIPVMETLTESEYFAEIAV